MNCQFIYFMQMEIVMENNRCTKCNGKTKYYDKTRRIIRLNGGKKSFIFVDRYRCEMCGFIHRILPDHTIPYKHYDSEIITGVLDGLITEETYGYEDYPCEMTMKRWRLEFH